MTIDLDAPNLVINEALQPDIRPMFGAHARYKLMGDFSVRLRGREFTIPDGFDYDGMSIPQAVWSVAGLTPDGSHRLADLIHDYGYTTLGSMGDAETTPWSRRTLDMEFARLAGCAGTPHDKCDTIYFFVDRFGWIAWNKHKGLISGPDLRTATMPELVAYYNANHQNAEP